MADRQFQKTKNTYDPSKYVRGSTLLDVKNIKFTNNIQNKDNKGDGNGGNFNAPNSNQTSSTSMPTFSYENYMNNKLSSSSVLKQNDSNTYGSNFPSNTYSNSNLNVQQNNFSEQNKFSYDNYKQSSQSLNSNNLSKNNQYQDNNNDSIYKNYIAPNNMPSSNNIKVEFNPLNFSISNSGIGVNNDFSSSNVNNNTGTFQQHSNQFSSSNVQNVYSGLNNQTIFPSKSVVFDNKSSINNDIKKTVIMSANEITDQAQETYNPYESLSFEKTGTYVKPSNPNVNFNANTQLNNNFNNNSAFPDMNNLNIGVSKSTFPSNSQFPKI